MSTATMSQTDIFGMIADLEKQGEQFHNQYMTAFANWQRTQGAIAAYRELIARARQNGAAPQEEIADGDDDTSESS